jgi:peroxiredoxin (alkyl hydroperoxide reductase subunit C)
MAAFVSQTAPDFSADAYFNGGFEKVSLSKYKGKKLFLFFYPLDFTFVCPLKSPHSRHLPSSRNEYEVLVFGDSNFTHRLGQHSREEGGIKGSITHDWASISDRRRLWST